MRQFRKLGNDGVAAIEFAVVGTLLLLLLVGVIDLGIGCYEQMQVQNAAEVGAQYVAVNGYNLAGINQAVASSSSNASITASPAPTQFCGCPGAGGIAAIDCTTTCTDGTKPSKYVQVNTTLTHWSGVPQGIFPSLFTLTGTATVRIP